jgi:nickel-dependent lactate racemase
MRVQLQYGEQGLVVDVPGERVTVIEPRFVRGLDDERAAVLQALRAPLGRPKPSDWIKACHRLAIVVPDGTRPLPSHRILPWLLSELGNPPPDGVVIVVGTGSHRANDRSELVRMLGEEIVDRYEVVNHDAHDPATLAVAGRASDGRTISMNRRYVEADRRIVLGFVEPHFMAGFSGGYKGVFPAVADIDSILHYHRASVIADPRSTWGVLEGNPTQDQIRRYGSLLPVDLCVNVSLNKHREITAAFAGDPILVHERAAAFVRETAMVPCARAFPIVLTTNGGYPLDQNLYQTVKGISAAALITEKAGLIVVAARCDDGYPEHGNFKRLLTEHESPEALMRTILAPGYSRYDQWQAQLLAANCLHARVALYSELSDVQARAAHLEPVQDIAHRLARELERRPGDAAIAVLPEGPMTIPYLTGSSSPRMTSPHAS